MGEKMSETNVSETWIEFRKELREKCREQELNSDDFLEWIIDSIKGIMNKAFEFYILSGPIPESKEQKIDATLLVGKIIYSFTVERQKKEFFIIPISDFNQYLEETKGDFIKCSFNPMQTAGFYMMDSIANSAKLRGFTHKILNLAWGEQ
jgi:hypothetical protein